MLSKVIVRRRIDRGGYSFRLEYMYMCCVDNFLRFSSWFTERCEVDVDDDEGGKVWMCAIIFLIISILCISTFILNA